MRLVRTGSLVCSSIGEIQAAQFDGRWSSKMDVRSTSRANSKAFNSEPMRSTRKRFDCRSERLKDHSRTVLHDRLRASTMFESRMAMLSSPCEIVRVMPFTADRLRLYLVLLFRHRRSSTSTSNTR